MELLEREVVVLLGGFQQRGHGSQFAQLRARVSDLGRGPLPAVVQRDVAGLVLRGAHHHEDLQRPPRGVRQPRGAVQPARRGIPRAARVVLQRRARPGHGGDELGSSRRALLQDGEGVRARRGGVRRGVLERALAPLPARGGVQDHRDERRVRQGRVRPRARRPPEPAQDGNLQPPLRGTASATATAADGDPAPELQSGGRIRPHVPLALRPQPHRRRPLRPRAFQNAVAMARLLRLLPSHASRPPILRRPHARPHAPQRHLPPQTLEHTFIELTPICTLICNLTKHALPSNTKLHAPFPVTIVRRQESMRHAYVEILAVSFSPAHNP